MNIAVQDTSRRLLSWSPTTHHHTDRQCTDTASCLNASTDGKRDIIVSSNIEQITCNHTSSQQTNQTQLCLIFVYPANFSTDNPCYFRPGQIVQKCTAAGLFFSGRIPSCCPVNNIKTGKGKYQTITKLSTLCVTKNFTLLYLWYLCQISYAFANFWQKYVPRNLQNARDCLQVLTP